MNWHKHLLPATLLPAFSTSHTKAGGVGQETPIQQSLVQEAWEYTAIWTTGPASICPYSFKIMTTEVLVC